MPRNSIWSARVAAMAALTGVSLTAGSAARADILPNDVPPAPPVTVTAAGAGQWNFTYNTFVTATQEIRTGDYFTFFDFGGYVLGSATGPNANWTFTESLVGPILTTPFGDVTVPGDDASLYNITFTYTGADTIVGGPTSLGNFTLRSTYSIPGQIEAFGGNGTDRNMGLPNGNITNYVAPLVPEPGEYAFGAIFGAGLLGLMIRARRRRHAGGADASGTSVAL